MHVTRTCTLICSDLVRWMQMGYTDDEFDRTPHLRGCPSRRLFLTLAHSRARLSYASVRPYFRSATPFARPSTKLAFLLHNLTIRTNQFPFAVICATNNSHVLQRHDISVFVLFYLDISNLRYFSRLRFPRSFFFYHPLSFRSLIVSSHSIFWCR